jgi:hypothetical protein
MAARARCAVQWQTTVDFLAGIHAGRSAEKHRHDMRVRVLAALVEGGGQGVVGGVDVGRVLVRGE